MQRVDRLIAVLALLACAALGLWAARFAAQGLEPAQAQADVPTTINTQELERRMGLSFVPADPARTTAAVTKDRAITIAREDGIAKGATGVVAELGYLGQAPQGGVRVAGLDQPRPIWFIRFQGVVPQCASGPPPPDRTARPRDPARCKDTYTVVVDAATGQVLFGMTY